MRTEYKTVFALVVVVLVAIILYGVLTAPDQRTTGERIGDAVEQLPENPEGAVEQLERRTPGERLGDAVEDMGEDIKRNTDNE